MSQTKMPKLTIRNREGSEGKTTTGANVDIRLNGEHIPGLHYLKLDFKPGRLAKALMEVYCQVDVDANLDSSQLEVNSSGTRGPQLGSFAPWNPSPAVVGTKCRHIKVHYASLAQIDLSSRFMVQIVEPLLMIAHEVHLPFLRDDTRGPEDRLVAEMSNQWRKLVGDLSNAPAWMSNLRSIQLVKCELMQPILEEPMGYEGESEDLTRELVKEESDLRAAGGVELDGLSRAQEPPKEKVIINLERAISREQMTALKEQLQAQFPDREVVVLAGLGKLSIDKV